jgi:uncharacterized membrane protein
VETQIPNPVFLNLEYIFFLIYRAVARVFNFLFGGNIGDADAFSRFFSGLKVLATIFVIILITIILYLLVRLYEIEQEGKPKKDSKTTSKTVNVLNDSGTLVQNVEVKENPVWASVRSKLLSDNQSDWRLAIIEADIYLDRVLDQKGFYGDTLGDKLKQIDPEKLPSVQIAWEAHKVRNRIAHDGADFTLTMPEARRVLSYYEIVFRDLEVID